jgi:hypothetical protein
MAMNGRYEWPIKASVITRVGFARAEFVLKFVSKSLISKSYTRAQII